VAYDLATIDVSDPALFQSGEWRAVFAQMRAEAPVHFCANGRNGPFWSITRYDDIFAVETDPARFSSAAENGGIVLEDRPAKSMMQADPPIHTTERRAVRPVVSPANLKQMEGLIRERTARTLDSLPRGERFDWVDWVAVELTSLMLATLFDLPAEHGRKLTQWSEYMVADLDDPAIPFNDEAGRREHLKPYFLTMLDLLKQRRGLPPSFDIISIIAQSPQFAETSSAELVNALANFIVGGNDTTRNTMTGAIWAFSQFPDQLEKLRVDRSLMTNAINELIRFQTPIIYQRRTTTEDVTLRGQTIRKGDKVALWYISANRDEAIFPDAERLDIERKDVRRHLSFGTGPHRCIGAPLAELQLRIFLDELLGQDLKIEVLAPPTRAYNVMAHAIAALPVRIAA
jgi:cytochrome P450